MRNAQKGEIVVITEPCYTGCSICLQLIGRTALVAKTHRGTDEVVLQFVERKLRNDPKLRGGFFARNLYRTGMTA